MNYEVIQQISRDIENKAFSVIIFNNYDALSIKYDLIDIKCLVYIHITEIISRAKAINFRIILALSFRIL